MHCFLWMILMHISFDLVYFRIFVNRSLHMENIKFFGFDMDYTLAGGLIDSFIFQLDQITFSVFLFICVFFVFKHLFIL